MKLGLWGTPPPSPPAAEGELDWVLAAPWTGLFVIVSLAVVVLAINAWSRKRRAAGGPTARRGDFDLQVAKMENLPVSTIAQAAAGPVRIQAVLVGAEGTLGGPPDRSCVWRNRHGAARDSAIASPLVLAADETGQVALENLERARVIAPRERQPGRPDIVALYVGDHVELLGDFVVERHGLDESPEKRVYGVMGATRQVQVRVETRPSAAEHPKPAVGVVSGDTAGPSGGPGGGQP